MNDMSIVTPLEKNGYICFDKEQCSQAGHERSVQYQSAQPFPHIVMDDFLPQDFLAGFLPEFPATDGKNYFDRDQERLKYQFAPEEVPGRRLRNLLMELNSPAMLAFLEGMTGITHLVPDPYYAGGGLHETKRGGHLSVHADFNVHAGLQLERRLNLLIYLNDDWEEDYGGHLELWDQKMEKRHARVLPVIGRAVVFNTSLDSFHGQPDPVACPPGRSRRSIATYYYTAPPEGVSALPRRTTVFKPRPQTEDRQDLRIMLDHFMVDWVPPKLLRFARKLNRFK
jgi:Rps23 Pro-64 3,4-dihydroxylase Tpa1-like proline 4-hydroxylase